MSQEIVDKVTEATQEASRREQQSQEIHIVSKVAEGTNRNQISIKDEHGNELFVLPPSENKFVVVGAQVRCTLMMGESCPALLKDSSTSITYNGAPVVTQKDIYFSPYFDKCRARLETGDSEVDCEPEITGGEWLGHSGMNPISPDLFAMLVDNAYMICEKGGLIYITEDGQTPASRNLELLGLILAGRCFFCVFAGDPVNMATGNFIYEHTDLEIGGAVPLSIKRFYNVQTDYCGIFGKGWVHNYEIKIIPDLTYGGVKILFEDGRQEIYWLDENGKYTSVEGIYSTLTRIKSHEFQTLENRGYLLEYPDKSCYQFDKDGNAILHRDSNGKEIVFSYDKGLLIKVSSISGEFNFIYEEMPSYKIVPSAQMKREIVGVKKLVAVKDHTGRAVYYRYKKYAHNTYVLSSYVDTKGGELLYFYDYLQRLSKIINKDGICLIDSEFDIKDRVVKQHSEDGGEWIYEYDENNGDTILTERNGSKITYMKDHLYRTIGVKYPRGYEYFYYNDKNQRIKVSDKNNNKTNYMYDDKGNLVTECNALDIVTEYDYTDDNKIKSITIAGQKKFNLEYDENGDLSVAKDALGNITTFEYAQKAVPEVINLPDGSKIQLFYDKYRNITKIINAVGVATEYQYDTLHRVIKEIDGNGNETSFQYDTEGNIIQIKNAIGDVQTYVYNNRGLLTQFINFNGSSKRWEYGHLKKPTKIIDQLGRETKLSYNLMWHLEEIEEPNGAKTKIGYDKECNITSIEKPNGGKAQIEYDPNGNYTSLIDEEGNQFEFIYDVLNRLIKIKDKDGVKINYIYNADGQVTSETDALGNTTHFVYDEAGRLIEKRNPLNECYTYTYTPLGGFDSVIDEAGRRTRFEYKKGGQLWKLHHPDGTYESFDYDNNGNLKNHIDRLGNYQEYTYDVLNRIIKIEKFYKGEITANGETSSSTLYGYDSIGNIISKIDEEGNITSYEYTLTGKVAKVIDALKNETRYKYDVCDRLIEVRKYDREMLEQSNTFDLDADLKDIIEINRKGASVRITGYQRNISGQVEKIIDALGQAEEFYYDIKGQLIKKIDGDGLSTQYGYNVCGDISSIQYADGREVKYGYDSSYQLNKVEDWLGTTKISRDSLGRIIKISDYNGRIIEYIWRTGNVKEAIIYPGGKKVKYQYDDLLNLKKTIDDEKEVNYNYDKFGRLSKANYSNDIATYYEYNSAGKLKWFSHKNSEEYLDSYFLLYDLRGNKVGVEKNRGGLSEESKQKGWFKYQYDELNRLEKVYKSDELIKTYIYDGYGNRIKLVEESTLGKEGKNTAYSYNVLNQLISRIDNEDVYNYSYDNRGNLTDINKNSNPIYLYCFGAINRVEKVYNYEKKSGVSYRYNGLGHRVGKVEMEFGENNQVVTLDMVEEISNHKHGKVIKKVEDVLDFTKQYHNLLQRSENQKVISYVWDNKLLSIDEIEKGYHFYLLDEMGSPIRMLSEFGSEIGLFEYDEFGNKTSSVSKHYNNKHQPFSYSGYQTCNVSDDVYAQAREYSPTIGRFISRDKHWNTDNMIFGAKSAYTEVPSQFIGLLPDPLAIEQSSNSYGYTVNNPLKYIDPSGLTCEACEDDSYQVLKWFLDGLKIVSSIGEYIIVDNVYVDKWRQATVQLLESGTPQNVSRFDKGRAGAKTVLDRAGKVLFGVSVYLDFNKRLQEKDTSVFEAALGTARSTVFPVFFSYVGVVVGSSLGPPGKIVGGYLGNSFGNVVSRKGEARMEMARENPELLNDILVLSAP